MDIHALLLFALQGLTEFWPVSSTAHVMLFSKWRQIPPLAQMDVAFLHLIPGVLLLVFFRSDVKKLFRGGVRWSQSLLSKKPKESSAIIAEITMFRVFVIAVIPTLVIGLILHHFNIYFHFSNKILGVFSIVCGFLLGWADKTPIKKPTLLHFDIQSALIFGFLHPLAFLPGVSRLGLSLTIARFLGFSREDSARLSFLVGLPILLSAGSLSLIKGRDFCTDTLVSLAVLSLIGWLSLLGFMKYTHSPKDSEFVDPVLGLSGTPSMARRLCSEPPARHSFGDWGYSRTGNFFIFAWYRIFLGFVLVALEFIGKYFSH